MRKSAILCGLLILLLLTATGCFGRSDDARLAEALTDMKALGESMTTFSATVEQSATVDGQEISSPYSLWYKNGRYRMEWLENGVRQVEIFDGKDAWTYVEGGSEAWYKANVEKDDIFAFLQTFTQLFTATYQETATVDGRNYHVLSGTMNSNPEMFSITWWISKESGFPEIIKNEAEAYTATSQYRDIRINEELDDALFTFTPTEGMEIIDIDS